MLTVDIEKIPFFQDGVEKGKIEERFDNAILTRSHPSSVGTHMRVANAKINSYVL